MRDPEQAGNLLTVAEREYRALCGMEDTVVFSDEIFGFHVQQAVEKALKAWLSYLGVSYPKRHDLDELAALLEDAGQPIPAFACGLLEFTDFCCYLSVRCISRHGGRYQAARLYPPDRSAAAAHPTGHRVERKRQPAGRCL